MEKNLVHCCSRSDFSCWPGMRHISCPRRYRAPNGMDVEAEMKLEGEASSDSKTNDYGGACGKLGLGLDYLFTPNLSIGTEVSYVWGFGDVQDYSYLYWQVLGIVLHF